MRHIPVAGTGKHAIVRRHACHGYVIVAFAKYVATDLTVCAVTALVTTEHVNARVVVGMAHRIGIGF